MNKVLPNYGVISCNHYSNTFFNSRYSFVIFMCQSKKLIIFLWQANVYKELSVIMTDKFKVRVEAKIKEDR